MIEWIKKIFSHSFGDVSEHRKHTTKYEDLCM
jgi:hypothetical protein